MKALLIILILLLTSSCSFNKLFLVPEKIPPQAKVCRTTDESGNELIIQITEQNFQPHFYNSNNEILITEYDIKSYVFESNKGKKLNSWLIYPKKGKADITVFILHGNGGNLFSQYEIYTNLVKQGFQVVILDYSGFGFSEGRSTRKNTLNDAQSFIEYFNKIPEILKTTKVLYGQSYGGHLAAVICFQNKKLFNGVIIDAAFSSPKDIAAVHSGMGIIARLLTRTIFSAYAIIDKIDIPILFVHSKNDNVIPYILGEKLYEKAKEPKHLITAEGCHTCALQTNIVEITEFITKLYF